MNAGEAVRPRAKRFARAALAVCLAGVSIYYVVAMVRANHTTLRDMHLDRHPWLIAASVAVNAIALSLGCGLWWLTMAATAGADHPSTVARSTERRPSFASLWRVWAISNPARYIPGRVWHVATLGWLGEASGTSWALLVTSLLVHMWFVLLANLIVALGAVPSFALPAWVKWCIVAGVAIGVAIGIQPRALNGTLAVAARLLRRPTRRWPIGGRFGVTILTLNVFTAVVAGVGTCVVARATIGLTLRDCAGLIAAQSLAFVAGYVSLVPAGLGVREAALTLLLTPIMATDRSAMFAILLRLWNATSEVLLFALAALLPHPPSPRVVGDEHVMSAGAE